MPVRAVTFDCYGTLIDWEQGVCDSARDVLARSGNRITPDSFFAHWLSAQRSFLNNYQPYRQIVSTAAYLAFARSGINPTPQELSAISNKMASWPAFDDAKRLVPTLSGRFQVGILSNVEDEVLAAAIRTLGSPMDFTVTAEQVKSYKPGSAHFIECLRRIQLAPAELLHVGWYEYDVVPAHAVGMRTCWINRSGEARTGSVVPDFEVSTLDDLRGILEGLH